jgi:hypothetical protein
MPTFRNTLSVPSYPEENIQHTEHGESLKSRTETLLLVSEYGNLLGAEINIFILFSIWIILNKSYVTSDLYIQTCLSNLIFVFSTSLSLSKCENLKVSESFFRNSQLIKSSHAFYGTPNLKKSNSSHPTIFLQELDKIHLYPRARELYNLGLRTKTYGCISVQSNTFYKHRLSHSSVRITVQNKKLFIAMFTFITFSLLRLNICFYTLMSIEVITLYTLHLIVTLFNVLCLSDTLYFKVDEGKLKRNYIHR